jgi:AraC-like DNA-binding protein
MRRLIARLAQTAGWPARFDLLEATLLARFADAPEPRPDIAHAWRVLTEADGRIPIAAIADDIGCSHRHLVCRFREHIGVTPKLFARLMRFDRTVESLDGATAVDWATLALDCGYCDQAHLIREFRAFSGLAPSLYLRRSLVDGTGLMEPAPRPPVGGKRSDSSNTAAPARP